MFRYGQHLSTSSNHSMASVIACCLMNGCHCAQVCLGPMSDSKVRRKLSKDDIVKCRDLSRDFSFVLYSHFPYVFNLVKPQSKNTLAGLQDEINTMASIGGRVVIHPNSPCIKCGGIDNRVSEVKKNVKKFRVQSRNAIETMRDNLEKLTFPKDYTLLLEPPAGEGQKIGWSIEQMKMIVEICGHLPVGICLDTCHVFASGVCDFGDEKSVNNFFKILEKENILPRVKAIHLNDSEIPFGEKKDRHAPICYGYIWGSEESFPGFVALGQQCKKHSIDVICEVGTHEDIPLVSALAEYVR